MDITLEVMLPKRGTSSWLDEPHPRYRIGSVVAVYPERKRTDVVGMALTGYIHITGLPIQHYFPLEQALQKSCVNLDQKRAWYVQWHRLPMLIRNTLLAERQVEIPFPRARAWLRNQDEGRDLTDADLA